ncbi:hypothetical protein AWV80_12005 [Cupriavidus sp. UYMU48A]|nr:hypothetical protein AWV80_12005 [Cupriavidus sp. UYMU48A]
MRCLSHICKPTDYQMRPVRAAVRDRVARISSQRDIGRCRKQALPFVPQGQCSAQSMVDVTRFAVRNGACPNAARVPP